MKAKIKPSGFIVDVNPFYDHGRFVGFQEPGILSGFYLPEQLEFIDETKDDDPFEFDWDAFRNYAARDIFCAILASGGQTDDRDKPFASSKEIATGSIYFADELIRQLKDGLHTDSEK